MVKHTFPKPNAIILDLSGTVIKPSFIDKFLFPYIRDNIKGYVEEMWTISEDLIKDVERIRRHQNDCGFEKAPKIASNEAPLVEQKQSVIENVLWFMDNKKESRAHILFNSHMWFDGIEKDKIKTSVYSDVAIQLNKWKAVQQIKIYIFSHGWTQVVKKLFTKTNYGNINFLIDGMFDPSFGSLTDPQSYQKILNQIKEESNSVYFLTKSIEEAKVAKEVGIKPILVLTHRRNVEKLKENERIFPIVRSFIQIEFI